MITNEVIPTLDMVLEELDTIIQNLNKQGAKLMAQNKYPEARDIISKAETVIAFQGKTKTLREEWLRMAVPPTSIPAKKKKPVKRTGTKMLKKGLRTPNEAFLLPILQTLVQLGGSGQVPEVLDLVEEMMSNQLNKYDYQSIPSNPKIIRWRNNAQWARLKMVEQGYLADDSPRGIWEISEAGRQRVGDAISEKNQLAEKPILNYQDQTQSKIDKAIFPFEPGKIYHRQHDLHDKYGGNRQSGIVLCAKHPFIFLFTSPRGDEFGYQDGWVSEDIYHYTGEGQIGDMEMVRGNLAIRDHQEDGRALHLFKKVDSGLYEYVGQFEYIRHEIKKGINGLRRQREIIRFVLKRVDNI